MIMLRSFESALRDLVHLIPLITIALEHGAYRAREYFDIIDQNIEPYLASMLLRFHATLELKRLGQEASEEVMSIHKIPNIGIYIHYGIYHIRVLKSDGGELPTPGSVRREAFYNQQPWLFPSMSEDDEKEGINLLILWDTHSRYNLNNLYLVYPKQGGRTKDSIDSFWSDKIPENYMFGIQPEIVSEAQEVQTDLQMSLRSDLKQVGEAESTKGEDKND
jgi:hypothetical protein